MRFHLGKDAAYFQWLELSGMDKHYSSDHSNGLGSSHPMTVTLQQRTRQGLLFLAKTIDLSEI